ncbi:MAG: 3-deoxy-D-manno-octulosonic acid transferase, partial [Cytophagia bacterium]|nr:3-deoxy-D-manno-octulosonic acid transferase [Cytophagia bacterium]
AGCDNTSSGLESAFENNQKPVAWFHTASMGEFEQGKPIIDAFSNEYPNYFILVTFFSPSGYEVRKNSPGIDYVSYLPFDGASTSKRFLDLVNPSMVFFVKYEFWYFYLHELKNRNINTILVSAIFRKNQPFFKWYGGFFRNILTSFEQIFVQDESSKGMLHSINIQHVTLGGDTRFDRVLSNLRSAQMWSLCSEFVGQNEFVVLGSVWDADMDCLIPLINSGKFPFKWVVVPHEINESTLKSWESKIEIPVGYSKGETLDANAQVLFVNEVGRLSSLYRGALFAYIGGAFGAGLHNTLEAAVFGPTVFFGNKNFEKFHEAVELVNLGLAFPVVNSQELEEKMLEIYHSEDLLVQKQVQSRQFVASHAGATACIMNYVRINLGHPYAE